MIFKATQQLATRLRARRVFHRRAVVLLALVCIALFSPAWVLAQVPTKENLPADDDAAGSSESTAPITVTLPDSGQIALALSTPALRNEVLLDLVAAENILEGVRQDIYQQGKALNEASLVRQFLDDRGWLARLVERYGWVEPYSAILDPAAWLVQAELQQHELPEMALEFLGRRPQAELLYQVFQRAGERLAAENLPILLLGIEGDAVAVWEAFLRLTGPDGVPVAAWKTVESTWFSQRPWPSPESFAKTSKNVRVKVKKAEIMLSDRLLALSKWVANVVEAGPPDPMQLAQLRFQILEQFPRLGEPEKSEYSAMLHIASLVDGLQDGRYLDFTSGVLSLVSDLLEHSRISSEVSALRAWLVAELPPVSARYAADFAMVDPNLNVALATAYGVLKEIGNSAGNGLSIKAPRAALADAVAQLSLLIPDLGYYSDTPVRARVAEEINVCTSIAAARDDEGYPTMTRRQFDACMENFVQLASHETRTAELSGDFNGPFSSDALRRELSVTAAQRINYVIGYLEQRFANNCKPPAQAVANPLEWAVLANSMTWFAEYAKEFFTTPANEARLAAMRNIGEQVIKEMAIQLNCIAQSNTGVNDPVSRSIAAYESALRQLNAAMVDAETVFRQQSLRHGADILLDQGTQQHTGYRPDGLLIEPCDKAKVCEMSGGLSTTRALIGLFPEIYLIADQSAMGKVEICYQHMGWVRRRSELVRPDDKNVANYYGHLGFDLVGRYVENGQHNDIFDFRFISPQEYHYLFAQASAEVLQDGCPMGWVGTRVVTPLREDRGGIVPNRLTYLAASRALPSRLLQSNWDQGSEWRDWFVTGIGVAALELPATPNITTRLNQHLQSLYQAEQAEIYRRLFSSAVVDTEGDDVSLFEQMSRVSIAKAMLRVQMVLFYPDSVIRSDAIRAAIAGDAGLLDFRMFRRFKAGNVAPSSVDQIAQLRLQKFHKSWLQRPVELRLSGSIPPSLARALTRINSLYRELFTSRPKPLGEIDVQAPVPDPGNAERH